NSRTQLDKKQKTKRITRLILLALAVIIAAVWVVVFVPFGRYDFSTPDYAVVAEGGTFDYQIPLDDESPWPKFRANELQNGRSPVEPVVNDSVPWQYRTGKGIFSSPVIDGDGNIYIGSADTYFYRYNPDG